ncbi:MAG: hypothetical protein NTZ26_09755 [Candidatus Aminicenantes bacterium]|nr:hypothetical protein [Candidatus Aminicenantes bacterium]
MSLAQWAENGWIKPEPSSAQEIANSFSIVNRDLNDVKGALSADWRLGIAYNAGLKLAMILLRAEGYRTDRQSQHYRTIHAIPLILGKEFIEGSEYLHACRSKRNTVEYTMAGAATHSDAQELIDFVVKLREVVRDWLKRLHPELC